MSNSKVTFRTQVLYTDAYSQNAAISATVEAPYNAQVHGSIDLPATTAAGPFTIPFGSVTKATAIMVRNLTGQSVDVSIDTGDVTYTTLPDGKSFMFAAEALPDSGITAVTVTTGDVQAADGHIAYDVWGDPL